MADIKVNQQTGELAVRGEDGRFRIYQPGQYKFNKSTNQYAVPGSAEEGPGWKIYDATGTVGPTKANATAPTAANSPIEALFQNPSDLPMGERFQQGVGSIGQGVVQLINKATGGALERNVGPSYDEMVAQQQADYQERREEAGGQGFDLYRTLGEATALAPVAAGIPTSPTWMGALGLGAAGGGAMGALTPVTDPNADFTEEKLKQILMGAGVGAATGGVLRGAGGVLAPQFRPEVQALIERGVRPTPGQIAGGIANQFEEKIATTIPGLGDMITMGRRGANEDFQRAVYNEVLEPIGAQVGRGVEPGRDAIRQVGDIIGEHYDQILQNVNFLVDQQLNTDVRNVVQASQRLRPEQRETFEQIFNDEVVDLLQQNNGTLTGQQFKGLESQLSTHIRGYRQSQNYNERQLGQALADLQAALRDSLTRTNPMYAEPLQNANAAFARLTRLEDAAGAVGNDLGQFTPQQFQHAVKKMDSSSRKRQFARGEALLQDVSDAGRSVLADKFPNSGTPGRILAATALGGGASLISPWLLAGGVAASLPYTSLGRAGTAFLASQRPALNPLAQLLPRLALPAGAAGSSATIHGQ
jgi:hypothetical protein